MDSIIYYLKKILGFLRLILYVCIDFLICIFKKFKSNNYSVFIIRLDAIGDFFLWLDQAKEYKKIYPDKKIILVANQIWFELAKKLPYWDEVISVNIKKYTQNLYYRIKKNKEISKYKFDKVINPTYSRSFLLSDSIIRISNADEKIGFNGNLSNIRAWQKRISDRWYTKLISSSNDAKMELIRNAEFIRGLGDSHFKASVPQWPYTLQISDNILKQLPNFYYIIFPGAGVKYRQWPIDNFVQLAQHISAMCSCTPILCGGPGEKDLGNYLAHHITNSGPNLVGRTTLADLVSIIQKAQFVIANETCAVHIASAVNTPSVCIVGGGHFGRFVPYQTENQNQMATPITVYTYYGCFGCDFDRPCLAKNDKASVVPCIQNIYVDQVWEHVKPLIDELHSLQE